MRTSSLELRKLGLLTTDRIELNFGFFPSVRKLKIILSRIKEGEVVEIMSHAGYKNRTNKKNSRFLNREKELKILRNLKNEDYLSQNDIKLINFQELTEV
jgi:predicted glycoside hydrolase/deacetylase ChbG (UPF0249 family)